MRRLQQEDEQDNASFVRPLVVFRFSLGVIDELLHRAVVHLGRCIRLPGMAELAVFDRPCDIAIVAGTAVLAIDDLDHVYFIRTSLEREAQIAVADLAAKPDAMKPVRKYHRSHASIV